MASGDTRFNDSSGDSSDELNTHLPFQKERGRVPQTLELRQMPAVTRDSGCFTGSPMTAPNSAMKSCKSPQHFFTGDADNFDSDEDDDVFQLSQESFNDSGLQNSSRDEKRGGPYLYRQQEHSGQHTDSDDDSSTVSGEFTTAEFELTVEGAIKPMRTAPINIPTRSHDSSQDTVHDGASAVEVVHLRRPMASSVPDHHAPLQRRATVSQMEVLDHPNSNREGYGGSYHEGVQGAHGPLPDVVPSGMRPRTMSESALSSTQAEHLARVGKSLRDMCDEFSETTLRKQLNLLNIQNRSRDGQVGSFPQARRRRSIFGSLFSSSQE